MYDGAIFTGASFRNGGSRPHEVFDAGDVSAIYRDLRKGREDRKDEPGAADSYSGEMELRRAATLRGFERILLWLSWWGFPDDRDLGSALLFAVQSTTSLLRASDAMLTFRGEVIQIV